MRKDFWKQPDFFFILLPVLAALWALLSGLIFYPRHIKAWSDKKAQYAEAAVLIEQILQLEPARVHYQEQGGQSEEFDYTTEVDRFTKEFGISSGSYTLNVRQALKQKGKTRKSADLSFKSIKIETAAGFLSAMLARWPDLQCEQIALDKAGTAKNEWNVKLRLVYIY
ncbi:MAG TPA: hypothetical protein PK054_05725 [Anaerohalosphaeraceae bacterium]|nr:hypothetical protein [Anaerohalosphaeraceae bacterium]HOL88206.1 hypothetical protein [Anaerohalosphaeraceae bacterium]HPP56065.1 hypothetical protein [Anaerohalosphaeraceae bacterium]